ncbi:MAG: hypothetical protein QM500_11220 [Methylococcales bacterium]
MNNDRFNGYNPQNPDLAGLTDCVDAMTDRAEAVLVLLMKQHVPEEESLIWSSLDSVLQEIKDVKNVVEGYYRFQRSVEISEAEAQKNPSK